MLRSYRYEEIAEDLRQQITQGTYTTGQRLPAERELIQQYGVQRNTIRQALTLLAQEGWLDVRARSGAFVASRKGGSSGTTSLPEGVVLVINSWNRVSTALDNVLFGLTRVLEGTPLTIQRFNSHPLPGSREHITPSVEYLTANNVVGAILWAQNPTDLAMLTRLRTAVPLVLIDRRVLGFEADCVHFDDVAGGRLVTEHLIAQGHRRIGFLADEVFAETVQQRWRGYTLALEAAEIPLDANRSALFEDIQASSFAEHTRLFLAGGDSPLTAVVCSNDSTALTLLRFLRSEGYRVPADIAMSGYGNLLPDYLDTLELTTVAQPFDRVGKAAGELLLERLQSHTYPMNGGNFRNVELPVELIVRNSTRFERLGGKE